MAKTDSKRQTRSDKFPPTLHKTGQYCKKIKDKLYYFGTDKKAALNRYLEQATYLHAGKRPIKKSRENNLSIKSLWEPLRMPLRKSNLCRWSLCI
jgi:hypothetical protein